MFHPVDIHVGKQLKALRIYRGFIQKDVANRLEISFQQLQKYETGANRVSASRLYEIARLFNVRVSHFFEGLAGEDEDAASILDIEGFRIAALVARIEDEKLKKHVRTLIAELVNESTDKSTPRKKRTAAA